MTRHVNMRVAYTSRLNDTCVALLLYIVRQTGGKAQAKLPVTFTVREAAAALGCCGATARRAAAALEREGLIVIRPNIGSDGGTRSNSYELTKAGIIALRSAGL